MLNHALAWLDRGFPVLPLQPRGKIPLGSLVPHGCRDASVDPAVISDWRRRAPRANIGVALGGGRFVLDLDGPDAVSWFANSCGRHGGATTKPPKPRTSIPGAIRPALHGIGAALEKYRCQPRAVREVSVRGAAPSAHPTGILYTLARDLPIAEAPRWLIDLALPPPPPPFKTSERQLAHVRDRRAFEGVIGVVAAAPAGRRNALLFWGAIKVAELAARGILISSAGYDCLVEAGAQAGLPAAEARRTVASAFQRVLSHG